MNLKHRFQIAANNETVRGRIFERRLIDNTFTDMSIRYDDYFSPRKIYNICDINYSPFKKLLREYDFINDEKIKSESAIILLFFNFYRKIYFLRIARKIYYALKSLINMVFMGH